MAEYNPLPLIQAAEQLAKLPGIGMKTAQRLAYHILNMPEKDVEEFTGAIMGARRSVRFAPPVITLRNRKPAAFVRIPRRHDVICVVEAPKTFPPLNGRADLTVFISFTWLLPMDNVGPNDIRIKS